MVESVIFVPPLFRPLVTRKIKHTYFVKRDIRQIKHMLASIKESVHNCEVVMTNSIQLVCFLQVIDLLVNLLVNQNSHDIRYYSSN